MEAMARATDVAWEAMVDTEVTGEALARATKMAREAMARATEVPTEAMADKEVMVDIRCGGY